MVKSSGELPSLIRFYHTPTVYVKIKIREKNFGKKIAYLVNRCYIEYSKEIEEHRLCHVELLAQPKPLPLLPQN